jgi:hypothetical protein
MDNILTIDINKNHDTFTTLKIMVEVNELQIKAPIQSMILLCTTKYFDANNADVTAQLAPKQVALIASNETTITTPKGDQVPSYDYLKTFLAMPVPVNTIITQYVMKNKDKF